MARSIVYADSVAVVTGASGGIGRALSRELGRRGARVALVARRRERLDELATEISAAGGRASVHVCDVSDLAAVEAACADVVETWDGIDLLVNNAGYVRHVLLKDHPLDDIDRMTRTNYLGTVAWMKHALPSMRSRGRGWIVNISSFAGVLPQVDEAAYSATKAAVTAISEVAGHEFEPLGISVLAVHPVLVRSEMFTEEVMARMPRGTEGRFIEAEAFCLELLRALERGETSVVIPRRFGAVPWLKGLLPSSFGRIMARARTAVLPDLTD